MRSSKSHPHTHVSAFKKKASAIPHIFLGTTIVIIVGAAFFIAPAVFSVSYESASGQVASATPAAQIAVQQPTAAHLPTPEPLYGIYMSQCVVGTPSFRASLTKFIEDTELNAVVIDIKDFSGTLGYVPNDPQFKDVAVTKCGTHDIAAYIKELHAKNIYVIARITVFQDPAYTKAHPEQAVQKTGGGVWKNYGGLAFVDVGAKPYWDYVVALSKDAYAQGFDELNYDYIRFPSDGDLKTAVYSYETGGVSKETALENFFSYLHTQVAPTGAIMSADLFGYTTIHTDDLGIGQVLERALPYFDYVAPMVYPSHYNSGFAGLKNVNSDPYAVVNLSLDAAVKRASATSTVNAAFDETAIASTSPQRYTKPVFASSKIRPWLQSFDYPVPYTPAMVEAQIKATTDAGLTSWLFWDAGNKYKSLRQVLVNTQPTAAQ